MDKKVSEILEIMGVPLKRECHGLFISIRYFEEVNDGLIYTSLHHREAKVPDVATVPLTEDGCFVTEGDLHGCTVGIRRCLTAFEMQSKARVSEVVSYCVKAVLIRLLVECLQASDTIKCNQEEIEGMTIISAGVKVYNYDSNN